MFPICTYKTWGWGREEENSGQKRIPAAFKKAGHVKADRVKDITEAIGIYI